MRISPFSLCTAFSYAAVVIATTVSSCTLMAGESLFGVSFSALEGLSASEESARSIGVIWKVKVPGAVEIRLCWRDVAALSLWDCAGKDIAPREEGNRSAWAEGDTVYVRLPEGRRAEEAIVEVERRGGDKVFYGDLAAHWAPTWYQDEDDTCPEADWITAFDFDGDYVGTNNWDNLGKASSAFLGSLRNEAVIYWWVVETKTHYYVGYADFHPRDWEDRDGFVSKLAWAVQKLGLREYEHENDMEGALLIVRKVAGKVYGEIELLQTQAHDNFWQYSPFCEQLRPRITTREEQQRRVDVEKSGRREDVDGPVVIDEGGHPVLYVQSKGHGVYGHTKEVDYEGKRGEDGQIYRYAGSPVGGDASSLGLAAWTKRRCFGPVVPATLLAGSTRRPTTRGAYRWITPCARSIGCGTSTKVVRKPPAARIYTRSRMAVQPFAARRGRTTPPIRHGDGRTRITASSAFRTTASRCGSPIPPACTAGSSTRGGWVPCLPAWWGLPFRDEGQGTGLVGPRFPGRHASRAAPGASRSAPGAECPLPGTATPTGLSRLADLHQEPQARKRYIAAVTAPHSAGGVADGLC